ncbi:hypothetical protein [Actinomadura spongiicola]|nr:hypothetical protein [Actinomadura spongiicola]
MFIIPCPAELGILRAKENDAAAGKSSDWPEGEPQEIRDAYDTEHGKKK